MLCVKLYNQQILAVTNDNEETVVSSVHTGKEHSLDIIAVGFHTR
jgi:hypothetical protein